MLAGLLNRDRYREWLVRLKRVQYKHWIAVVAVALILFDLFIKPLTPISVGLLIIVFLVLSPWASLLPNILESAELPGGFKVKFREMFKAATTEVENAGLLSEPRPGQEKQPMYEIIYNDDPVLALAGLRIAIEKRLKDLASSADLPWQGSVSRMVQRLQEAGVLRAGQASALGDLLPLLNSAIHHTEVTKEAADWAMTVGPKLIAGLGVEAVAAAGRFDDYARDRVEGAGADAHAGTFGGGRKTAR